MLTKYSIRKRNGRWIVKGTFWESWGLHVEEVFSKDTWEEALLAVNFLLSADRALQKMVNKSFN